MAFAEVALVAVAVEKRSGVVVVEAAAEVFGAEKRRPGGAGAEALCVAKDPEKIP